MHPLVTAAAAAAAASAGSSGGLNRKPGSCIKGQAGYASEAPDEGCWGQRQEVALPICSLLPGGAPVQFHCSVRQEAAAGAEAAMPPRHRLFPVGSTGYLESLLHQPPRGQVELSVYSKLWVYNCTGLPLAIRAVPSAGAALVASPASPSLPCCPPPVWVQPCLSMEGAATSAHVLFPMASRAAAVAAASAAAAADFTSVPPVAANPSPLPSGNRRSNRLAAESTPLRPGQFQLPPQRQGGGAGDALLASPSGAYAAAFGLAAGSGLGLGVLANPLGSPSVGVTPAGGALLSPAGGAQELRDQAPDTRPQGRRVTALTTPVSALLQKGTAASSSVRSMATAFSASQDGFVPPCMCGDLAASGAAVPSPSSLSLQLCVSPHTVPPSDLLLLQGASSVLPAPPWSRLLALEDGAAPMVVALPYPMPAGDAWHASLSSGSSPPGSTVPSFLAAVRLVRVAGAPPGCFALHVLPRFILHNTLQVGVSENSSQLPLQLVLKASL